MLAGITRMKTETLPVAYLLNMTVGDIQFAMTTAVIMLVMAVALLAAFKFVTRLRSCGYEQCVCWKLMASKSWRAALSSKMSPFPWRPAITW
jgi:hypothetical protein